MEKGWKRDEKVIAEKFAKDEIPGFLKKEFVAKGNEFVVLEKNGEVYLEKGPGKLVISSFMADFTGIILIDKSEKTLERKLKNVCLSDSKVVSISFAIRFQIFNSDHFSKNLMGERKRLFLEDVWSEVVSDVLCRKTIPKLQKKTDLILKDSGTKAKADIEADIKNKFKEWGLILTSLSVNFDIPDAGAGGIEGAGTCERQEIEKAPKREAEAMSMEEELSELEKERIEKEVRMEIEKKEVQRDMEDAMEALELKEVKNEEKAMKSEADESDEKAKLEEELKTLNKAKEVAEKKFYKKEISEEAFERMMEDFEKRIIEIETKLKEK